MTTAPFGTWDSPLSAAAVAAAGLRLSAATVDGDDVYWLEGRPQEGGRSVVVRRTADGIVSDAVPAGVNVRTRVHEYGGGAFTVVDGVLYFSDFRDQRLYRLDVRSGTEGAPRALTPPGTHFYADAVVDTRRNRVICVREDHSQPGEAVTTLVGIPLDRAPHAGEVLASGYDFYSTPRLSPDGSMLAWLSWRHPDMPWDGTELWTADVTADGSLTNAVRRAGSRGVSIYQPGWSPGGDLYYVSDADGWWHLYRSRRSEPSAGEARAVRETRITSLTDAEFGRPQWVFGTSTWTFAGSRLIVTYTRGGRWHLAAVDERSGAVTDLAPDLHPQEWLAAQPAHAVLVAGFADRPDAVVRVAIDTGDVDVLRAAAAPPLEERDISVAEPIAFPAGSATGHAFYYAPRNARFLPPPGERPPLIVITHGGPTAAASSTLNSNIQYWTTRGFAVVDVNYRGSTGFGREYRERLNGTWGLADVDDVIAAARQLVATGKADPARLIIRGGSAGGYTTLAALTFQPGVFNAGASYYGVSDLEALELDTHKFESRYSHSLIGPYPDAQDVYRARSPIHFIDRLSCPLIIFQGLEDKVVPPNQSRMMADALRAKGLTVVYLEFEGEQHGFRKAETIVRCLEEELRFYREVFSIGA